jgi:hypothetical protein
VEFVREKLIICFNSFFNSVFHTGDSCPPEVQYHIAHSKERVNRSSTGYGDESVLWVPQGAASPVAVSASIDCDKRRGCLHS